jgi:AbiJ N-terminal domain 4
MKFSQRLGITNSTKVIQVENMDDDLKNSLWNILKVTILDEIKDEHSYSLGVNVSDFFSRSLWHNFFKLSIDTTPGSFYAVKNYLREWFFKAEWFQRYDMVEHCVELVSHRYFQSDMQVIYTAFNTVLEREFSGYRFIQGNISPITNPTEVEDINHSINVTGNFSALKGCNLHLQDSLKKLSDKQKPDYRNSIKESISAVEAIAKIISGGTKDSLGGAIDKIKGKLKIHGALEKGIKSLYAYTSDSDGIRHSLNDESNIDFEDAKFLLVSCSAFVNYLIAKANKAGIQFS